MLKRVVWTGVGYSMGLASSIYVQRRVRRTVERYTPEQVRHDVATQQLREVLGDMLEPITFPKFMSDNPAYDHGKGYLERMKLYQDLTTDVETGDRWTVCRATRK